MGSLKHLASGSTVALSVHNVAGRAPACSLRLTDHKASNDHASLFWTGERWEVRDLGSTNGTFLGGTRLEPRENVPLTRGAILRFGSDAEQWELADDRGPVITARSISTGEIRAAVEGLLALPSADAMEVSILMMDGAELARIETSDGSWRTARNGEQLTVAGETWELTLPPTSPFRGTEKAKPSPALGSLDLTFHVSRDEEHVRVDALDGDRTIALGERSCFYMLLLLARARLAETEAPEAERGWYHVPDLMQALAVAEGTLNVTVHRARQAFAKAGVDGAEGIVERRAREVRIGTARIKELKS